MKIKFNIKQWTNVIDKGLKKIEVNTGATYELETESFNELIKQATEWAASKFTGKVEVDDITLLSKPDYINVWDEEDIKYHDFNRGPDDMKTVDMIDDGILTEVIYNGELAWVYDEFI